MLTVLAMIGVGVIAIASNSYESHLDRKLQRRMGRLMGRSDQ